jgi:hypothetical protein
MITIIEGTDGTGKSTHASWLTSATKGKLVHAGIPTHANWFQEYVKPIQTHLETTPEIPLILDRWHMGEMIWPTVFHRKSLFTSFDEYDKCCAILAASNVQVKVLYRSPDAIVNTLMIRNEQDQIDDVLRGQELFLDLVDRTNWLKIDVVNSDDLEREYADFM